MRKRIALAMAVVAAVGLLGAGFSYVYPKLTLFDADKIATNFASMDTIFPARRIAASSQPRPWPVEPMPLPQFYRYEGENRSVEDFLAASQTTSLIVIKDGKLASESYFEGYDASTRATSFSVAKSFVSTLVGAAIGQGLIGSVDDPITDYLPQLKQTGFDGASIADILQMSSGVAFSEDYEDKSSDAYRIYDDMFVWAGSIDEIAGRFGRASEPGSEFHYASINSHVLAMLLRTATGTSLSDYFERTLWSPLGADADAYWLTDLWGTEVGFWGLNATPRDFARLGQLVVDQGAVGSDQLVPNGWFERAVHPDKPFLQPGQIDGDWGYQYQWWVPRGDRGDFSAIGIWGQFIYVDPERRIVIVKTSTDADFKSHEYEAIEVFRAIASSMTEQTG